MMPNTSARASGCRASSRLARTMPLSSSERMSIGVAARRRARAFEQADDEILQRLRARGFLHRLLALPRDDRQRRAEHAATPRCRSPAPSDGG